MSYPSRVEIRQIKEFRLGIILAILISVPVYIAVVIAVLG